jgi:hypothetical protein
MMYCTGSVSGGDGLSYNGNKWKTVETKEFKNAKIRGRRGGYPSGYLARRCPAGTQCSALALLNGHETRHDAGAAIPQDIILRGAVRPVRSALRLRS